MRLHWESIWKANLRASEIDVSIRFSSLVALATPEEHNVGTVQPGRWQGNSTIPECEGVLLKFPGGA